MLAHAQKLSLLSLPPPFYIPLPPVLAAARLFLNCNHVCLSLVVFNPLPWTRNSVVLNTHHWEIFQHLNDNVNKEMWSRKENRSGPTDEPFFALLDWEVVSGQGLMPFTSTKRVRVRLVLGCQLLLSNSSTSVYWFFFFVFFNPCNRS